MELFLQRMTLKGLSALTKITWGSLRWELICKTLDYKLLVDKQQSGVFYA